MPRLTSRGKEYDLDELISLSKVGTYGNFSLAIQQVLVQYKSLIEKYNKLNDENNKLADENKELKEQLSNEDTTVLDNKENK